MLKDIRLAIFDFDDTLAIHKNSDYVKTRGKDDDEYFLEAFINPEIFYESIEPCEPSKDMMDLIYYCRLNDIKMYVLSGMRFSLHSEAKKTFVNKHYGDIDFLMASSQEKKEDVIRILKKAYDLDYKNILFIDDMKENVDKMKELGVQSFHVSEVKNVEVIPGRTLAEFIEYMND